jgi:HAMP domain-containing protein
MDLRKFILRLKIRVKLLFAFSTILLISILLISLSTNTISSILAFKAINEEVDEFLKISESLNLSTNQFIYEGYKSKSFLESQRDSSVMRFDENIIRAEKILKDLSNSDEEIKTSATVVSATLASLKNDFGQMVSLLKQRGFKDYGLEGSLRKAIHNVENSTFKIDKVTLLTLRRHEKDFFLRNDLKYQEAFNTKIAEFENSLLQNKNAKDVLVSVNDYKRQFNEVVDIETKMGLKNDEGLRGRIRNHFISVRPKIAKIGSLTKERIKQEIANKKRLLFIVFFIQLALGIGLAIFYANLLTKAIKEIRGAMQSMANGMFPNKLIVRTTEEIGQTKEAFNQFMDRLKSASSFAEKLGSGELYANYDSKFNNDVLAMSLISMQKKLIEAEESHQKINWINVGVAQFNDILKSNDEDTIEFGNKFLRQLVVYLKANQGALYILVNENEEEYLKRIATYAYDKRRSAEDRIELGNGLVGQCALEKSTIYMKAVPSNYVKITSGLGEATPCNIMITPLKIREKVMGVVELATFELLKQHQIEFVEKMAETLASVLVNKHAATVTKQSLEESQHRANMLAQQEEEMKQNAEEMQALQEEMERRQQELQKEILFLKRNLHVVNAEANLAN